MNRPDLSPSDVLLDRPPIVPPLDPEFRPVSWGQRRYAGTVAEAADRVPVCITLERHEGMVSVFRTEVLPPGRSNDAATTRYLERQVKSLLWQIGGWRLLFGGPADLGRSIVQAYSLAGARAFDARMMEAVYDRPFAGEVVGINDLPPAHERSAELGGHLDGCRLGFDLGASDYKLAAVRDGEVVFTTEVAWDPKHEPDPEVHFRAIDQGLRLAARHLPRVDAIGGSAAGIYLHNEVKVASLFRAVPPAHFAEKVRPLFRNLQRAWGVPIEVANDGDVTALAAAMSLQVRGVLGIAMGSSLAAGYLDRQGRITGWLNELAFAPLDYHPDAPADEWSGDPGVGSQYLSQQAVGRLLKPAGIQADPDAPLPEKLMFLQSLMLGGDTRADRVYQTLGVYLGYALAQYSTMYDYEHVLILGRVTTGPGADVMVARAREVLDAAFPDLVNRIAIHLPDEKTKRVGQAVAAASLPRLT